LQTALGDIAISTTLIGPGPVSQRVDGVIGVSWVGELEEALEVYPGDLVRPAGGGGLVEMAAKIPTQPKLGHRYTCAFGGSLHWLISRGGVLAG
jgi:hypothetical protein